MGPRPRLPGSLLGAEVSEALEALGLLVDLARRPRPVKSLPACRHVHELVRARSRDRAISPIWEGTAELELYPAANEELVALAPVRMGKGFRFTFGYTVDDLVTVKEIG